MGHEVVVVQTLADDELQLPQIGAAEFVDAESGRRVVVQAAVAADGYARRVREWLRGTQTSGNEKPLIIDRRPRKETYD